ncbi:hypothetical protein NUU61_005375 [Penicillium alfredii]|uniref:AB hydrolase-1 domain-containing protein n=1 Tax=Penicillium alfredii TaxID=1506179 RepID=A0A9W9F9P4_9EURO|nr:uncharacterized protein NUU61_005375 [Penicillium alfredii]KAJ5096019.1 hypothetical protein NUU61_005375 [Penicillium alfredii]
MDLSSPSLSFIIPSIHDGSKLECRVYLPTGQQNIQSATGPIRGAIVAHPYAPLGGCYDDPVVGIFGGELLSAGYIVGTFNFRGAGHSEGRTSWTARPELGDYVSFYGFMLQYLKYLKHAFAVNKNDGDDGLSLSQIAQTTGDNETPQIHLILGGYSYGSLIVSHVPTLEAMVELFRPAASPSKPIGEIARTAKQIAAWSIDQLPIPNAPALPDDPWLGLQTATVSYLLVSPLLPPISQLLTVFSSLSLNVTVETSRGRHVACPRPADQLTTHRTLALFGDQDNFTSAQKLRKWSSELAHVPHSQFQWREIDGAGHFWREDGVELRARQILAEWLSSIR